MNWPGWLFGLLWIPALGLGFYAWKGRGGWLWLMASVLFAGIGFFGGHFFARALGWYWGRVGPWALGPAIMGAMLVLFAVYALLRPRTPGRANRRRAARRRGSTRER